LLQTASKRGYEVSVLACPGASGSLVMESFLVLIHIPGNKHFLESGRGTKDNRTLRKFSIARAHP
jgi:hypothetical protein